MEQNTDKSKNLVTLLILLQITWIFENNLFHLDLYVKQKLV